MFYDLNIYALTENDLVSPLLHGNTQFSDILNKHVLLETIKYISVILFSFSRPCKEAAPSTVLFFLFSSLYPFLFFFVVLFLFGYMGNVHAHSLCTSSVHTRIFLYCLMSKCLNTLNCIVNISSCKNDCTADKLYNIPLTFIKCASFLYRL